LLPPEIKSLFYLLWKQDVLLSIYGLKNFSARAKAKNFSYPQLYRLCDYAKKEMLKFFVAFNTLIKQNEISEALRSLETDKIPPEPDAVIIQDFALANLAGKYFPRLGLHASTQMAIP
jgi:putative protease